MYICIGASFATALLISFVISTLIHQIIARSDTSAKHNDFGITIKNAPLHEVIQRPFEILFKGIRLATINMPRKFSREEIEEDYTYSDFGDLQIFDFFEEDGAKRNILHDWSADETDYRPPTQDRDDDVDM
jgi:hypothetical protein